MRNHHELRGFIGGKETFPITSPPCQFELPRKDGMRTKRFITTFHLYYRNIVYFKCFTTLLFRNSESANLLDRTSGIPAREENFSNKFRHAISSLPKPWEWSLKEWPRVAPLSTCVLIHLRGSFPSSSSSLLSIEAEKLSRYIFEYDHARISIRDLPCKKIIRPL